MNQLNLNDYKQEIADLYTKRSEKYDDSNWHWRIANRLVEYGQVNSGQTILDIATGTGHCAFSAAKLVGETGKVIGIDISPGMILRLFIYMVVSKLSLPFFVCRKLSQVKLFII